MRKLMTLFGLMMAMVLMPFAALAAEAAEQITLPLDSLPGWVGIVGAVLYGVAHAVARLPASITNSWPSWLKSLLNLIAANYGNAKNRDD